MGATPRRRLAWACTCQPSPMPIKASPRGGVAPYTGRKLRIGIAAPAAVVQPQGIQRHTEALARTSKRRLLSLPFEPRAPCAAGRRPP